MWLVIVFYVSFQPVLIARKIKKDAWCSLLFGRQQYSLPQAFKQEETAQKPIQLQKNLWFQKLNNKNKNKNSKYGLFFFVPLLMSLDIIILLTYFFYRIIISILFYITMIVYKFVILSGKIISVISNWSDRKVTVFFFRLSFVFSIMFLVTFNRIYPIAKMNIESTAVLEFLSGSILIPILLSWILELKNKPLNEKKSK